jgi:UDP-glucose 4-epimerase
MAILITGGSGFIGLHTVRAFLDAGEEVVATQFRVRRDPSFVQQESGGRLKREALDITSPYGLGDVMRKHKITGIVHLAVPGYRALSPSEDYRTNTSGLLNVLDAAQNFGVARVTIASSIGVYQGVESKPYVETMTLPVISSNPTTAFKKAEEILGLHYADRSKLDLVFARIAVIYGPLYHSMANPPSRLLHRALKNDSSIKIDDVVAADTRDYCYVKDCAQGLYLLHTAKKLTGRVYNVGAGRATSNAEIAEAVAAAVPGAKLELRPSGPPAETDGALDLTAISRDAGYKPKYDVRAAIADYAAWLKANPY